MSIRIPKTLKFVLLVTTLCALFSQPARLTAASNAAPTPTNTTQSDVTQSDATQSDVTQPFGDLVTVEASPLLTGQAKALNRQKNAVNITHVMSADQIGRFPDANAAEAAQRIPGVTLQRSQGEGRYVLVRATEARFNSMTVNGERLPSPESEGGRRVPLDLIPADLLAAIEVTKTLTPDMDGDAIGGTVNLVTRRAPERARFSATVAGGYNEIVDDSINSTNAIFGRRFGAGKKLGLLVSGSFLESDRGSDNIEPEYEDGLLDTLELRDYETKRRRGGGGVSLDYRFSDRAELFLHGLRTEFTDNEIRRRKRQRISRGRIDRELRHRPRDQSITSLNSGGHHLLNPSLLIDYGFVWSLSKEKVLGRIDSTFTQRSVEFAPNVSPDLIDPDDIRGRPLNEDVGAFFLSRLETRNIVADSEDVTGRVDFTMPFFRNKTRSGFFKTGFKLRFKDKESDTDRFRNGVDGLPLTEFLDDFESATPFFDGRYDIGFFQSLAEARRLADLFEARRDIETDITDFRSEENVVAAYGMAEIQLGNLTFLGGLRLESTEIKSAAFELIDGDDFLTPVVADNRYDEFLPMFHLRYALSRNSNLRAAVTRTLARPDFVDLVPTLFEDPEDRERQRGNPDLGVTTAWNLDLLFERFLSPAGVVSVGVFYKQIDDNIITFRFDEVEGDMVYDVTQPRNAEGAELLGVELAFQSRLHRLPAPFDGLGLDCNYTYTDSSAEFFPGRRGSRLPNQARHVGNLALSYEKGGFSGRLSVNYHSAYLREVGEQPATDTYEGEHFQVDVSAHQRLTGRLSFFLEMINLTDEPLRRYEGSPDRLIQEELYSWAGSVGLKWDF